MGKVQNVKKHIKKDEWIFLEEKGFNGLCHLRGGQICIRLYINDGKALVRSRGLTIKGLKKPQMSLMIGNKYVHISHNSHSKITQNQDSSP